MNKGRYFWLLAAVTVVYAIWMGRSVSPLTSAQIVDFELARTRVCSETLLQTFGPAGVERFRKSIQLDFVFIFLYTVSIGWGCYRMAQASRVPWVRRLGFILAAAMPLAGCCDVAENFLMLKTLDTGASDIRSFRTFVFAGIKFLIISASLLFFAAALVSAAIFRNVKNTR